MTAAARFMQSDVTRALKGAEKAGMRPSGIEIDPSGKIVLLFDGKRTIARPGNSWDDALP